MSLGKIALFGLTGTIGLGIPATAGAYNLTRESIWQQAKDKAIPNTEDVSLPDAWKKLKTKLSSKDVKSKSLQDIKAKASSEESGNDLKQWCLNAYSNNYKSMFQKPDTQLLKDVENACVLTIKDKIDENKRFQFPSTTDNQNENEFKEKMKLLKEHKSTSPDLDDTLNKLSKKNESDWKELEAWCKSEYEKPYQGDSIGKWKLVELYCVKK